MKRNALGQSWVRSRASRVQTWLATVLFLLISFTESSLASEDPIFQLETGGHLGTIKSVAFAPDGQTFVSVSDDKTIRIWSAHSGQLLRTIRGQSGEAKDGQIYSLAISGDGKWMAVAGWFDADDAAAPCCGNVRLYDFKSGQLTALLKAHTNAVYSLAFSPDSGMLVSAGADATAIVWDVKKQVQLAPLNDDTLGDGRLTSVAFAFDGKSVLAGGSDGIIRQWEWRTGKLTHPFMKQESGVSGIAVSSSEAAVFAGYSDGTVQKLDLSTGHPLLSWTQSPHAIGSIALSGDGKRILTTCGSDCGTQPHQLLWDTATGKAVATYAGHDNIVKASSLSSDGNLAITGGGTGHELHGWNGRDGKPLFKLRGQGQTVWSVGIAKDGSRIAWGYSDPCPNHPYCPNGLGELQWQYELPGAASTLPEPGHFAGLADDFVRAVDSRGPAALSVRDGSLKSSHPTMAILDLRVGKTVIKSIERGAADGYSHLSYSFLGNTGSFVSGGQNGVLTAYYADDGQDYQDYVGHTGAILAVASSQDGRLLVTAGTDQTLRIWNGETSELVASLFLALDGNWIIWTPQGYYDASRDADKYIGWQINQGEGKNARFIAARELKRHFYRWDIVESALILASPKEAVNRASRTEFKLSDLLARLPPEFAIISPLDGTSVDTSEVKLQLDITSESSSVSSIDVVVNGQPVLFFGTRGVTGLETNDPVPQGANPEIELPLDPGQNVIQVKMSNQAGSADQIIRVGYDGPSIADVPHTLRLLSIGVNAYGDAAGVRNLSYAVADAEAIADSLGKSASAVYKSIVSTILISRVSENNSGVADGATASKVRAALANLSQAKAGDTTVLFMAGHGTRGDDDQYYFLPEDASRFDGQWVKSTVVTWSEIEEALSHVRGNRIILFDTCRSANSYNRRLMKDTFDGSLVIFSATDSKTLAQEKSELGHGVFSYAILEGIGGLADKLPEDRQISIAELAAYVLGRVESLTYNKQIPEIETRRLGDLKFESLGSLR